MKNRRAGEGNSKVWENLQRNCYENTILEVLYLSTK